MTNEMSFREAFSVCAEATEHRAEMWKESARGYLCGSASLDCFEEADEEESTRMADLLQRASEKLYEFISECQGCIEELDGERP